MKVWLVFAVAFGHSELYGVFGTLGQADEYAEDNPLPPSDGRYSVSEWEVQ